VSKVSKIIRREYVEAVRRRTFLLSTLLVPLLMIGVIFVSIFFAERGPEKPLRVALVDKTGGLGEALQEAMDDTLGNGRRRFVIESVRIGGRSDEEIKNDLVRRVQANDLDAFILVPPNVMESGAVQFYAKSIGVLGLERYFENALGKVVVEKRLLMQGFPPDQLNAMMEGIHFKTLLVEKGGEKESGFEQEYATTMAAVMILYMTIMVHGLSIMRSVLEEKSSRVIEIILSSVTSMQLMVGKIIGTGLVSLTQYAIWAAVALVIMLGGLGGGQEAFNLAEHISWGEVGYMVLFFLLGFLLFGTAYAAIGAMCNTEQEANHLHTPLVMLLVAPVLVAVNVIQDPSGLVARVLSFIPFSAPIVMFMRINVSSVSGVEIGLSVLGIVVSIIVMFWIVARIFRVGILMYGKRPSLPELIRWIRYA
jgi:ABC-2 type transport system permease protein